VTPNRIAMSNVKLFEAQKVRTHWDEDKELWYFSIIDVIQILTGSNNPRRYWNDLKRKLEQEGFSQLYDIIVQLKLESSDGKKYLTDCTDTQGLLRIIQSIPSPKAEPFMQWLAQVGYERIEEDANPELSFDIITKAWSGKSVKQYKKHKKLKNENLRDHMTNMELVLNMLAEVSTTAISTQRKPTSLDESKVIAQQGGAIAGNARKQIEAKTGKKLVSKLNAKHIEGGKPKRNKLK
jgi:hypothetical protein